MAQALNTDEGEGEQEGSSSNKPTLKEFLRGTLSANSDAIHTKLTSALGIDDVDPLIFCDEQDLNELCQTLQLPFGDRIKFKAGIRKLKLKFQPQLQSQPQPQMITISHSEQSIIDKLNTALKQTNEVKQLFERHVNTVDKHVTTIKGQMDTQIDNLIQALQDKKTALYRSLEEWKSGQLEAIRQETAQIAQYHNALTASKTKMDALLRKSGVEDRDDKMREIVDELWKENGSYRKYQDISSLKQCVVNHTKLVKVIFEPQIEMKLDESGSSEMVQFASITLDEVRKTEEDGNGYKVQLNWASSSNQEEKVSDFTLKYAADEKKEMDWSIVKERDDGRVNANKYSVNIKNHFAFDTKYCFVVQNMIKKPFTMLIQSNIKSITVDGNVHLDMSKEQQIPLNIHSHKGHQGGYPPERILRSNTDYYLSPSGQCTDDWIILNTNDGNMYCPTKLQLVVSSGGLNCGPKQFWLKVGNATTQQWINCHENIFIREEQAAKPTFQLNVNSAKRKQIKSNNFKQFKLEILDNYAPTQYILITELKLFGVKL
eukprot:985967_1